LFSTTLQEDEIAQTTEQGPEEEKKGLWRAAKNQ